MNHTTPRNGMHPRGILAIRVCLTPAQIQFLDRKAAQHADSRSGALRRIIEAARRPKHPRPTTINPTPNTQPMSDPTLSQSV